MISDLLGRQPLAVSRVIYAEEMSGLRGVTSPHPGLTRSISARWWGLESYICPRLAALPAAASERLISYDQVIQGEGGSWLKTGKRTHVSGVELLKAFWKLSSKAGVHEPWWGLVEA